MITYVHIYMHYMYKNEQMNSLCGEREEKKTLTAFMWKSNVGKKPWKELHTWNPNLKILCNSKKKPTRETWMQK